MCRYFGVSKSGYYDYVKRIRDLYDNSIVAYKTAASQTVNLVLDTIRLAMRREKKKVAGELQLHSDQGFQYTSQAYFHLTQSYRITPSMSRHGNPYDNVMAETLSPFLKLSASTVTNPPLSVRPTPWLIAISTSTTTSASKQKLGVAPLSIRHSA